MMWRGAIMAIVLSMMGNPFLAIACDIRPLFSPIDDVESAIAAVLQDATTSIDCSLYGLSNARLAHVLAAQAKAGVRVRVGLDQRQSRLRSDRHTELIKAGVAVAIKNTMVLEHNKFCIIDRSIVVMGSWNWSQNAKHQDNSDVIFSQCPVVSASFQHEFTRIWSRDGAKG